MEIVSKVTGSALSASEFNQIPDELENLINKSGQTASSSDLTQVTKAVSQMVGDADFYSTSGTANAIILSAVSPRVAPSILTNGLRARFVASATNSGTTTINVNNLGAKTLYLNGSVAGAGDIRAGFLYEIAYKAVGDYFDLQTVDTASLLNKKMITNCILEAPNGVCTLWQGRIVVNSGIKYLIPNGTNSDGTLKNIEVTSTSKVYNYTENDDVDVFLFLDQDGNTFTWLMRYTFIITTNVFLGTETGDAQTRLVYITRENQWYYTSDSGNTWIKAYICCIASFHAVAQSVVNILSEAPLHLFSDSKADIQQLTKLGFPTSVTSFPLALGATDTLYTAVANGYIIFACLAGGADSFVYLQGIQSNNSAGVMSSSHATLANQFMLVNIPVLKGQKFQLSYYDIVPTGITFGIVGAVGEDNT